MFIKKYGDIIVGVFFMLLSAAMLVMAKMLPKSTVMDIGPDFMPMCIGVMTFVLAAALVFLNIKNMKIYVAQAEAEGPEKADYKRVLTSFIIILVYVFVLKSVGFIISTLVYLPVQMFILAPEERRGKRMSFSCCSLTYCLPSWYFSCSATDSRLCCLQVSLPSTYRR